MSEDLKAPTTSPAATPYAGRYRVLRLLGRGGMAIAEEVADLQTGRHIALKRMLPEPAGDDAEIERLFEREFYSLSQLAHPRVVQVYDFARDDAGYPYYTMELLDGGDLRELAPLPYIKLCPLLADVCSALSLLQSRRLVHRDVTPRNIRCTRDGKAKLIDFGTVLPFGIARRAVGTPPFCAPEALSGQAVDGRSDLFSLGATAYYALTGRHAYPARDFGMLPSLWQRPVPPPSQLMADIPPALDRLVLSLLQLKPEARPENAAEVIERLSAVTDFDTSEYGVVGQAYLSNPGLVGRAHGMQRARRLMQRAQRGRGGVVTVIGRSGMGRTRFLGACVLEAKLLGLHTFQTDATTGGDAPFGAIADVLRQLQQSLPKALGALSDGQRAALASLRHNHSPDPDTKPRQQAAETQNRHIFIQNAVVAALLAAAAERPLLLAIDDLGGLDRASAAVIALLIAQRQRRTPLVLITSIEREAVRSPQGVVQLALEHGRHIKLRGLSQSDSAEMLSSMVGQVRGLPALAEHLHHVAGGVPSHIVQLAEHLLDTGHLRYEAGTWLIADDFRSVGLPATLEDALSGKLNKLGPLARQLAQSLALLSSRSANLEEILGLGEQPRMPTPREAVLKALDDLMVAGVVGTDGEGFWLRHRSLQRFLTHDLNKDRERWIHQRLAALHMSRTTASLLPVYHLALADEPDQAIAVMRQLLNADFGNATPQELHALAADAPDDLLPVIERLVTHAKTERRTRRELFQLHQWAALVGIITGRGIEHFHQVFAQLQHDSGLDIYHQLPAEIPASERLSTAFMQAQQRFDDSDERTRVMGPLEAIQELAKATAMSLALYGVMLDYQSLESAPDLSPYAAISPAVDVIQKNAEATLDLLGGRYMQAQARWREVLVRLDQEDRAQLDEVHHRYMRLAVTYGLGTIDATLGRPTTMVHADTLASDPLFEVNAERIRMVYAFRSGDIDAALRGKRRIELLRLRSRTRQLLDGGHILIEAQCYASADDPFRLKATFPDIDALAERFPQWAPVQHLTRGYYHRLRGRPAEAQAELSLCLSKTKAGQHVAWGYAAAAYVHCACDLGAYEHACSLGQDYLKRALAERIEHSHTIREALARALCGAGRLDEARAVVDAAIAGWDAIGSSGTLLAVALETAARIALARGDEVDFRRLAARYAHTAGAGKNAGLAARHDALMREAQKMLPGSTEHGSDDSTQVDRPSLLLLNQIQTPLERAMHCARILAHQTRSSSALVYLMTEDGPRLRGRYGSAEIPAQAEERLHHLLFTATDDDDNTLITATAVGTLSSDSEADHATPSTFGSTASEDAGPLSFLLCHEVNGRTVATGMAVFLTQQRLGFVPPYRLMSSISTALAAAGDATPIPLQSPPSGPPAGT